MILIPNQRRDHYGASHRTNFDTPPLKGSCLRPKRFHLEPHHENNNLQEIPIPTGTGLVSLGTGVSGRLTT